MRGHFSIEWLAQSSQVSSSGSTVAASGISAGPTTTSGTHPESLPGFYCQQRMEKQDYQARRGHGLTSHNHPMLAVPETDIHPKKSSSHHQIHQVAESGFISAADEEETSGYESEGGRSLSPIAPLDSTSTFPSPPPPSPPTGRRPRTVYTEEQINCLELAFKRNAYLGTQEKAELCSELNLTDKQIRNWFQNRRMRTKRMIQDAVAHACQAKVASQLLHYPYLPGPYSACNPHHTGTQGGPSAPFFHPHYGSSANAPGLTSLPTLDSFYQYASLVMPSAVSNQALVGYQAYPRQY